MWKKVDEQGSLHSLVQGDRAAKVEFDGSTYKVFLGRKRGSPPRNYWTWSAVGERVDLSDAQKLAEQKLPAHG